MTGWIRGAASCCMVAVSLLCMCVVPARAMMSTTEEVELGRALARQTKLTQPLCKDPALQERVNRIGGAIVSVIKPAVYPIEFTVLASPEFNAYAYPGGFVFVYEGLLRALPNDDCVAYILAHEVTHVIHRHIAAEEDKLGGVAILGTLASVAIKDYDGYLAGLVTKLSSLSFSRDSERDADKTGITLAWQAGYDPAKSIMAFDVMASLEVGDTTPKYLRDHPRAKDRKVAAQEVCAELATQTRPQQTASAETATLDLRAVVGDLTGVRIAPNDFFPLAIGNEWVYSVSGQGGATGYTVRVVGAVTTPGGEVYRAETAIGQTKVACQMLTTENQVFRRAKPTEATSPWRVDTRLDSSAEGVQDSGVTYVLVGLEEVIVPCGKFADCRHLRREGPATGLKVDMWFAPKVGLVKRTTSTGVTEVLSKYRVKPPSTTDATPAPAPSAPAPTAPPATDATPVSVTAPSN